MVVMATRVTRLPLAAARRAARSAVAAMAAVTGVHQDEEDEDHDPEPVVSNELHGPLRWCLRRGAGRTAALGGTASDDPSTTASYAQNAGAVPAVRILKRN